MMCIYKETGKSCIIITDPSIIIAEIILALYKVKINLGHFPIYAELKMCEYSNLFNLVQTHGGISYFRKLMGHEENYRSALASYISRR